jgi:hypothetical protein
MVQSTPEGEEVRQTMRKVGQGVWDWLDKRPVAMGVGVRG